MIGDPKDGKPVCRRRGIALGASVLAGALLLSAALLSGSARLPAGALDPRSVASVRVVARDGVLLREVLSREDGRSRWVDLHQISPHLIQATLAAEDQRFFAHPGVDGWALLRAAATSLQQGRVASGASTLTMQLARLLDPRPRTFGAKLRQIALALDLEHRLSKREILRHYLNRAPYGSGTFGCEAAAWRYFNKPAALLSLAEGTLLAALPRSPSGYSPSRHRGRLLRRQRYILALMAEQGRISGEEARLARRETLAWDAAARPFAAPHLVERVLADPLARDAARIETTIDRALQEAVEAALRRTVERLRHRGVGNAAALVVDNASGEVLAYAGSADFFDERGSGQVDGTLAHRQAGSTIKPFTYALALERGATAASLLEDLPAHFATDEGDYAPRNYDDTFHGPVRLRVALGSSYNVPAVRTAESVGLDLLLSRLRRAGFSSLTRTARHYGLGLTLGNGEVSLQELVAAYATLARGGLHRPLVLVREVRTLDGRSLRPRATPARRVLGRHAAFLVSDILSDPLARLPAFGRHTPFDVGFPVAVKTGTSKDFRDNWAVGYTPQVTVGVWVGNFDGSEMHNVSGITGAGPLWAELVVAAQAGRPSRFLPPTGMISLPVCPLSGERAGPDCDASVDEIFVPGTEPRHSCTFHRRVPVDRRNGLLAGPTCPASEVEQQLAVVFPPAYRAWAAARGIAAPPATRSPLCPSDPRARAEIQIRFPVDGERYFVDPDLRREHQRLPLEAVVAGEASEVRWLVDGRLFARAPYPYGARWPIEVGRHTIEAELPGGRRSPRVTVLVR